MDNSLNYTLILECFIEQRAKSPQEAANYLAISVEEIHEVLRTGRVSVKVSRALIRMAPSLDLHEVDTVVPEERIRVRTVSPRAVRDLDKTARQITTKQYEGKLDSLGDNLRSSEDRASVQTTEGKIESRRGSFGNTTEECDATESSSQQVPQLVRRERAEKADNATRSASERITNYPPSDLPIQTPAESQTQAVKSVTTSCKPSLVGSLEGRRKVIQQGRGDPIILSMDRLTGEKEFYGPNAMAAVEEWRNLHRQSVSMQSRWKFDGESPKYLLCRDKILAVEIYLIREHALTIQRPQAQTPLIWDQFKRNEEVAVRLKARTSLITRYKEARQYEQRQAAVGLLKNIALAPVRVPGWVVRKLNK